MASNWGPRRNLVWLAERMAQFEEYFNYAESILLRLALTENEPGISNNATGIWKGFFISYYQEQIFLSIID